jgi:hypothetical protein
MRLPAGHFRHEDVEQGPRRARAPRRLCLDSKASESRPVPMLAHGRLYELSAGDLLTPRRDGQIEGRCMEQVNGSHTMTGERWRRSDACSSGRVQSAERERFPGPQVSVSYGTYGRGRPGRTASSTAVPGVLLTRKRSQVQTLSRPPDRSAGQAGFSDPASCFRHLVPGCRAANGQQPRENRRAGHPPGRPSRDVQAAAQLVRRTALRISIDSATRGL